MRLLFVLLLTFAFVYAQDIFSDATSLKDIERRLNSLSFEESIKLDIISALKAKDKKRAERLFKIYKLLDVKYDDALENVLLVPEGKYSIVVSKNSQELYIFTNEKGKIKRVFNSSCITGKKPGDKLKEGDQRTPNGVYFPLYFIAPKDLSEIYGNGAFPLNYPNIIDKLIFHKTGKGIWLHATNDDNRPPFSSNGCVVVKNSVFDEVYKYIVFKETPVIIVDEVSDAVSKEKLIDTKNSLLEFLHRWKNAWEGTAKAKDMNTYFSFYSTHMVSPYGGFERFKKHKKRVSLYKKWIKIDIDNIYISKDGRVLDFGDLYVISFDMKYRSNNYNWQGKKVLYIIKERGQWKILAEESL